MNYSVVIHKNLKNISDVSIVDEDMLPACFFLNNHLGITFSSHSFNSKFTYAKVLLFIYRYFNSLSISIVGRVESGKFFTANEYAEFSLHCSYKVDSSVANGNVTSFARISDKQLDNLIHTTQSTENRVGSSTARHRLYEFIRYIEYLYKVFHFANSPPVTTAQAFLDLERRVNSDIRSIKDDNADVHDPFEQAIPDEIYFKMLEIIQPYNSENPWKSSKLRNHLIINIFIETGIREGALAKLKLSNIKDDWGNQRLMITRTPNDPTDTRKKPATQKTKAHSSSIKPATMKLLKTYIETERKKFSNSVDHDFIFVSEKGQTSGHPLSLNSIYKLIGVLSKALGFKLYPHLFRHKWNEIFDTNARALDYTGEQIEDIRKYAMGWSEDSKMSRIYNEFKLAVEAQNLSSIRQQDFLPTQGQADDK